MSNEFKPKAPSFYRPKFGGSDRLFRSCWAFMQRHFEPVDNDNVMEFLDSIASAKVNNSKSSFYIRGE